MLDRLVHLLTHVTWQHAVLATAVSIALFIVSLIGVAYFLAQLPPTYFLSAQRNDLLEGRSWIMRTLATVVKNALGILLLIFGVIMAIPGVPGQGLLTILVGLVLVDFPGKRKLTLALLRRPLVLNSVNRLREKFSKPPLIVE
jgi:hypothetical protein